MMKHFMHLLLFLCSTTASAQSISLLDSIPGVSLRGLSVVDDNTVWASGSKGHVLRSVDGGKSFQKMQLKGYEKSDFRDIEAFSKTNAVIMSSGTPALILRTTDGGLSWKETYRNADTAIFLDAMDWMDEKRGLVVGDPVADKMFFMLQTADSGKTWKRINSDFSESRIDAQATGEAAFAASGTCLRTRPDGAIWFVTGGVQTHLWHCNLTVEGISGYSIEIPLLKGKPGTGAFSVAFDEQKNMVIVGGDYEVPERNDSIAYVVHNSKKENESYFGRSRTMPGGYRSCVEFIGKNKLLCTGPTGTDVSTDGGLNWKPYSSVGFHVVRKAKNGKAVFFAGSNGRVGKVKN